MSLPRDLPPAPPRLCKPTGRWVLDVDHELAAALEHLRAAASHARGTVFREPLVKLGKALAEVEQDIVGARARAKGR